MCKLFRTYKLFNICVKLCKMCQMCNPSPGVGPKICNAGQQRRLMTSESCQRHQRDHHHHDHCHTCQPHHLIHAPRRKDPTGILGSFYVKHVFCVHLLTPLSFSGAKSCIVYCLMGFYHFCWNHHHDCQKRYMNTEQTHLNLYIVIGATPRSLIIYIWNGRCWKMEIILCNILQSEPYTCSEAMQW